MANTIKLKRGSGSDPSANDLVVGELAIRTDQGKLFTKKDNGSVAEISGGSGVGLTDGDKGDITVSNGGDTFTIDNGVVTSAKIADGTIDTEDLGDLILTNAKVATNAAIAGSKISPSFTGNISSSTDGNTTISLLDTGHGFNASTIGISNGGRDLAITAPRDIRLKPSGGEDGIVLENNGTVELYHDGSKKFETTSSGVKFTGVLEAIDNQSILLGTSQDFRIRHTGSHSEITDEGTGNLRLGSNQTEIRTANLGTLSAKFVGAGAVELNHNGTKKFETSSTGISVTGDINCTSDLILDSTNTDYPRITLHSNATGIRKYAIINGQAWNQDALLIYDIDGDNTRLTIEPNGLGINRGANSISHGLDVGGTAIIRGNTEIQGNLTISGTVDGVDIAARNTLFGGLTSSSGVLTNGVTATTQSAGNNTTRVATTAFVSTAISNLINGAPSALDTLNELAAAMSDDAAFSTTVTNSLATKMPLAGGQFTGNITFSGSQTVDGRDLSVDGSKLDGIESGATADQTASEILTLLKTVDGAGSGLDADTLDGVNSNQFLRSNVTTTFNANGNDFNFESDGSRTLIGFKYNGSLKWQLKQQSTGEDLHFDRVAGSGVFLVDGNRVLTTADEGSGNGIDADTLDGIQASSFLRSDAADTCSQPITFSGGIILPTTGEVIKFGPGTAANDDAHIEWLGGSNAGYLRISTSDDSDSSGSNEYIEIGDYAQQNRAGTFTQHLRISRDRFLVRTGSNSISQADRLNIDSSGTVDIYGNLDIGAGCDVTGNITVTGTVDGRDVASDGSKLDGIESGATADQTASEILTLIKTVDGAGSGLDADTLDGISSGSFLRSDTNATFSGTLLTVNATLLLQDQIRIGDDVFIEDYNAANAFRVKGNQDSNKGFIAFGSQTKKLGCDGASAALTYDGHEIVTQNSNLNASNLGSGTIPAARVPTLNQNTTGSAATLTTARTIAGVSFDGSANISLNNNAITNGAGYITGLSFDNLSGKTSGTGEYSTSGSLVAGRGGRGVALTVNDGYGNANVCFNHKSGTPEANGNAARIEVNTDSTSNATMFFEVKSNVSSGVAGHLTSVLDLLENQIKPRQDIIPNSDSSLDIGSNSVRFANGYFDTLYGSGANLTALNASNISSGTIDAARVPTLNQNTTGNAATATQLANARTIAGVSFDGSANISLNNNAITNGAGYITATLTNEQVQDIVGGMVSGNTESGITVTYQDGDGTLDFSVASQTDNNFTNADHSKLDGIEAGATADQSASEILTLIKTVDGAGSGLDADTLDGISSASFLRSDAADVMSQGTQGTATLDVRNTGGAGTGTNTGAIIATFKGDSDALRIRNIGSGDYGIYNTQQNNGIELYDGGGGVRILYSGTIGVEFDNGNTYGDFKGTPTVNGTNLARVSDNITGTSGGFTAGNASNLNSGTIPDARFPSTLPAIDGSNLTGISAGATGGGSDEVFYENDQTVTTNYTITNGKNAMAAGPITINSGVTVTVGSGENLTIV